MTTGTVIPVSDVPTTWDIRDSGNVTVLTGSGTTGTHTGVTEGQYRLYWEKIPGYENPWWHDFYLSAGETKTLTRTYASIPSIATNLTATPGTCGTGKITVSWTGDVNAVEYRVNNDTWSGMYGSVLAPETTFDHTGLTPGATYGYRIKSNNSEGYAHSDALSAVAPSECGTSDLESYWVTLTGSLVQNETHTLRGKVYNVGAGTTGVSFNNQFSYQWGGTTGVWQSIGSPLSHDPLLAGGYEYDELSFAPNQVGTLYVRHCVDVGATVVESDETDASNCSIQSYTIAPAWCPGSGWQWAANEGSSFTAVTPTYVRYGAGSSWVEGTYSGVIECTNSFFGSDPIVGTGKSCEISGGSSVNNCSLVTTAHGNTDGTCSVGYAGACESSCDSGTWTAVSNTCVLPFVDDFRICTPDDVTCVDEGEVFIVGTGEPLKVIWETNNGDYCGAVSGTNFNTVGAIQGEDMITASGVASTSERFQVACNYGGGIPDDAWVDVVTLQELPGLTSSVTTVREGNEVELSWDTNNGDETLCTLSGGNIDGGAILENGTGDSETGTETLTINGRTTFVLTCGSLSGVKTIEIVPTGWEA